MRQSVIYITYLRHPLFGIPHAIDSWRDQTQKRKSIMRGKTDKDSKKLRFAEAFEKLWSDLCERDQPEILVQ